MDEQGLAVKTQSDKWRSTSEGGIILRMAKKTSLKRPLALDEARLRQQAIGAQLRQMFQNVVNEPVPDEFLAILRQADDGGSERN